MKTNTKSAINLLAIVALIALSCPTFAADRITVENDAGVTTFRVTDGGDVLGNSMSAQKSLTDSEFASKINVKDLTGAIRADFTADGGANLFSNSSTYSPTFTIQSSQDSPSFAPTYLGRKSRGNLLSPTATQAGDNLFTLSGAGYYGTGWHPASTAIVMPARETFTSTAKGADIVFLTTAPGTINRTEKFRATGEGNIGIGVSTPTQKLEVAGGVRINTTSAQPTCNSTTRGTFWFTQGGTGVKDTAQVCAKDAAGAYAWRTLY